jgi:squalene-hopene/tetraprenyl-beta-curcumene cyclase
VIDKGVAFLVSNVRPDGSWPIDTNLATWVTTLSVNALAAGEGIEGHLDGPARKAILEWLLAQQYRVEHPYTHAAPGGWAWTDLPGGVPDADDTAGAVLALRNLAKGSDCPDFPRAKEAASTGIKWLADLQNSDGGIPTFCRGWGKLPFDRSAADLTAHAILAMSAWMDDLDPAMQTRARKAISRGVEFLRRTQRPDGSWLPLWFGNQHRPEEDNPTYGTARVVMALAELEAKRDPAWPVDGMLVKAVRWLVDNQNADSGWGGGVGTPSSIEETALAVDTLAALVLRVPPSSVFRLGVVVTPDTKVLPSSREHPQAESTPLEGGTNFRDSIARGVAWLVEHTNCGTQFDPSPIGFYFAKLWYYEKLYPLIFTVAAIARAKAALARALGYS